MTVGELIQLCNYLFCILFSYFSAPQMLTARIKTHFENSNTSCNEKNVKRVDQSWSDQLCRISASQSDAKEKHQHVF